MDDKKFETLEKDIEILQEQIRGFNGILKEFSIAFKGSSSLDTVGIFQRLKNVEKLVKDGVEKLHHRITNLEKELDNRFIKQGKDFEYNLQIMFQNMEKTTTAFTTHLVEVDRYKKRFSSVYKFIKNLFAGKHFWRFIGAMVGLVTLNNGKEWGLFEWFKNIVNEVLNLFK